MIRRNLLFIVPSLGVGGAERQIVSIVNGLAGEKYNIHFFTFEKQLNLLQDLNREKIKFYNYPRRYKLDITPCKQIANIIDLNKINIVYSILEIAFIYGFIGRVMAKKKPRFIASIHTTFNPDLKREFFERFIYAPLLIKYDKIITVCSNQNRYLANKYPFLKKKLVVRYNGVDTRKFIDDISNEQKSKLRQGLGVQNNELIIGMIANFRITKSHEYAFKALKSLLDSGVKIKLILIGDGKRKGHLQSLAKKLGISQNIVWLGVQSEPKKYISIFEILLLTSVSGEAFSNAVLEALSMNKPVIATDIGGTSEMVVDGLNGYLVRPKDPKAIAEKIQYLAEHRDILQNLSDNARQSIIHKFDIRQTIEKTRKLLEEIA
jgi:glycosyltransferase involved in cell wall biosynthesis